MITRRELDLPQQNLKIIASSAVCKGLMASKTAEVLKPFPMPQSTDLTVHGKMMVLYCNVFKAHCIVDAL